MQARLFLNHALFADPKSGIKIYIDHQIDEALLCEAKQEIAEIVASIKSFFLTNEATIEEDPNKKNDGDKAKIKYDWMQWNSDVDTSTQLLEESKVDENVFHNYKQFVMGKVEKGISYKDFSVRRWAFNCLGELIKSMQVEKEEVLPLIEKGISDENHVIQHWAWMCLGELIKSKQVGKEMLPLIEKGIRDKDFSVQDRAGECLCKLLMSGEVEKEEILSLIEKGISDENYNVKQLTYRWLYDLTESKGVNKKEVLALIGKYPIDEELTIGYLDKLLAAKQISEEEVSAWIKENIRIMKAYVVEGRICIDYPE